MPTHVAPIIACGTGASITVKARHKANTPSLPLRRHANIRVNCFTTVRKRQKEMHGNHRRRRAPAPPQAVVRGSVGIDGSATETAGRLSDWISDAFDSIDYAKILDLVEEDENDADGELDDESDELIYGEFSLPLLCALMEELNPDSQGTFLDIGSGRGQLVLAAAKGWSWGQCVGLELVPELFYMAREVHDNELSGLKSPCRFVKGSMYDAAVLQEAFAPGEQSSPPGRVVAFLYATKFQCKPPPGEEYLLVSETLKAALPPGSTVITINRRVGPDGFELISERTGPNPEGGEVVVYVWRVT